MDLRIASSAAVILLMFVSCSGNGGRDTPAYKLNPALDNTGTELTKPMPVKVYE